MMILMKSDSDDDDDDDDDVNSDISGDRIVFR